TRKRFAAQAATDAPWLGVPLAYTWIREPDESACITFCTVGLGARQGRLDTRRDLQHAPGQTISGRRGCAGRHNGAALVARVAYGWRRNARASSAEGHILYHVRHTPARVVSHRQ